MFATLANRCRSWNVNADLSLEIETIGREVNLYDDAGRIPELDGWMPADSHLDRSHGWELIIEFRSQGASDPGRRYGPPERCYPPEYYDDRSLVTAYLIRSPIGKVAEAGEPVHRVQLPLGVREALFERFESEINAAELQDADDYDHDD